MDGRVGDCEWRRELSWWPLIYGCVLWTCILVQLDGEKPTNRHFSAPTAIRHQPMPPRTAHFDASFADLSCGARLPRHMVHWR